VSGCRGQERLGKIARTVPYVIRFVPRVPHTGSRRSPCVMPRRCFRPSVSQLSGDLLDHELPSVERDRVTGEPTFARFASSGCAGWALTTAITLFVSWLMRLVSSFNNFTARQKGEVHFPSLGDPSSRSRRKFQSPFITRSCCSGTESVTLAKRRRRAPNQPPKGSIQL